MKKLLLASVDFSKLKELTKKPLNRLKLAYIPTAGDPYKDKWFLEEDRKKLRKMGINFFEVDLKNRNKQERSGKSGRYCGRLRCGNT